MDEALGQLLLFAGTFVPVGFLACNGQTVSIEDNTGLWETLGNTYGGNGTMTVGVPDLPPVPSGNGPAMSWSISSTGTWPGNGVYGMTGQVRPFPFPVLSGTLLQTTWLPCDGRLIAIKGNEALFSLLGTVYGGDGQTTFALPTIAPLKSSNGVLIPWFICLGGIYPQQGCNPARPFSGNEYYDFMMGAVCQVGMAPSAVATLCQFGLCNGQTLPYTGEWDALYSLIGTLYGAQSQTEFSLPNVPTPANGMTSLLVTEGYYPRRP